MNTAKAFKPWFEILLVAVFFVFLAGIWLASQQGQAGFAPAREITANPSIHLEPSPVDAYPAFPATPLPLEPYAPPPTQPASTTQISPVDILSPTENPLKLTATAVSVSGTTTDIVNRYSIQLPPTWWMALPNPDAALGIATFSNYDLMALDSTSSAGELPRDLIRISISNYDLSPGTSFDQWLSRVRQANISEGVAPGSTVSDPEPVTIASYAGVQYYQNPVDSEPWLIICLMIDKGRALAISIDPVLRPEGQEAISQAMQMLNTLLILP